MIHLTIFSFFPEIVTTFLIFFAYFWGMSAQTDLPEQQNFIVKYPGYFFQAIYAGTFLVAFYFFFYAPNHFKEKLFLPFAQVTQLSFFVKNLIFLIGAAWLGFRLRIVRRSLQRDFVSSFEYLFFASLHLLSCLLVVSAQNFLFLYLAFILQHISFFFLSYREEDEVEAKKSLLKHAVFDLMALLVLAIALIGMYLGAGALHFSSIGNAAQAVTSLGSPYQDWARLSLFMVIFYVFSRLRAFPFCFFRDTVPLFLPRAGVLHVICQVFSILFIFGVVLTKCFSSLIDIWGKLLFYGGFLSLVWASLTLLFQDDIRKFLSSIVLFYGGMVLMCISVGNTNGLNAALFYSVLFLVNAATLIYFLINVSINDMNISSLSQISGLGQKHPATAIILAICLLSLASVPPFSGFWTTLYVLKELIFKGWIYVAIILLCIVLSSFQYFHVMRLLYFSKGYNQLDLTESWKSTWLIVPIFLTFFFLFHKHIITFISMVTNSSWSS